MKRILIISRGTVGTYMSSPGIRAYYMAQVLARHVPDAEVTLAVPNVNDQPEAMPGVRVVHYTVASTTRLVAGHDIVITSGLMPHFVLSFAGKRFVADLFSLYPIEWLEQTKYEARGRKRAALVRKNRAYIGMQLTMADFILCSNERQRDAYIGMLSALGLIDPAVYDRDDSLRRYIDVAPNGVRPDALHHERRVLKGVLPGVRETDKVVLWNGGTVSWYDPEPFLRALHLLSQERDDVKGHFLATLYPGIEASLGYSERFTSAVQLAKDLGLYDRGVSFGLEWVAHEDVKNYLLESDVGICTYFDNLETHFSHRSRFLDLIWAELPIICTEGGVLADLVRTRGLGVVVPEGDAPAVAEAIRRLVDDRTFYEACREHLRAVKPCLAWEVTLEPLVRFCREGASYAPSKRERLLPLLTWVGEYALARGLDAVTPKR